MDDDDVNGPFTKGSLLVALACSVPFVLRDSFKTMWRIILSERKTTISFGRAAMAVLDARKPWAIIPTPAPAGVRRDKFLLVHALLLCFTAQRHHHALLIDRFLN